MTESLLAYFQDRCPSILESIRGLVEQESMSRVPEANRRLAQNVGQVLTEIGAEVEILDHPQSGGMLRARFGQSPNQGGDPESEKALLVVGHLDTVWPIGTLARRPFRVEGGQAFGPGIFDMKAGVALAVHSMRAIAELGLKRRRPTTFLMTCDEETGSVFSRQLIEGEAAKSHAALVLEPPIPGGAVKTGRKGVGEFEVIVHGRSAHAGIDPRAGISAITELAHQVLAINALCDFERGSTLNVGVISGGVLSNVVAAEARARVDIRFQNFEECRRIEAAMRALKPVLENARIEVLGGINRPPMVRTDQVARLFEHARGLARDIGFELTEGSVGGASDGNFIGAMGVPVLDGLGVDGAGAHAENEHILIIDIPRRAALLTRLIETI